MEKKTGKWDLAKVVAEKTELSQKKVGEVIDVLSSEIVSAVMDKGSDVNLPLLGTFKKKVLAAHKGFNPLTKQPLDIPETHNMTFKPTAAIKRTVETESKKTKKVKK